MDLRELFDELVDGKEPPTRLTADSLYASGQSRTRARTLAGVTSAAVAVVAVIVGVTTLLGPSGGSRGTPSQFGDNTPTTPADRYIDRLKGIQTAIATDANTLYVMTSCPSRAGCTDEVLRSTDGGHSWSVRSTIRGLSTMVYAGGNVLLGWQVELPRISTCAPGPQPTVPPPGRCPVVVPSAPTLVISTDGAQHWNSLVLTETPVAAVPPGGLAICIDEMRSSPNTCTVYVVDPVGRRAAPLAAQPPGGLGLGMRSLKRVEASGTGVLWVMGAAASTQSASGLAVAVSRDAGRTWRTTTIDQTCPGPLKLWFSSGATAKALCSDGGLHLKLYRTDDYGTTWHQVPLPQPFPFARPDSEFDQMFLSDGTFVGAEFPANGPARFWRLREDSPSWQSIPGTGLPAGVGIIDVSPDGTVLAFRAPDGHDLYRSSDLSTWTRIPVSAG